MISPTISSVHRYSSRFLRSTDLVRDFHDPKGLDSYWLTDFGKECLVRISDGFRLESGHRAWRLTGDFGSGKSSFALLLANVFRDAEKRLPKGLRDQVLKCIPQVKRQHFIPVLVMGSRERMSIAILRSLHSVLADLFSRGAKSTLDLAIEKAIQTGKISDKTALELIQSANEKIIQTGKGDGLLLILDEVGKFLEYAALNPDQQDVFFMQELGEKASRSGKHPLIVVCLLHQGFNAYTEHMAEAAQREWEKISGRFEEIIFHQPLDQVAFLVASALNPDTSKISPFLQKQAETTMTEAIKMGWYGTSANRDTLHRVPARLYPLDPTVLPVMVRVFQRYGQNERSLFGFLCSYEPCGLRAFSQQLLKEQTHPFQLADFYDYVRTNFGHRLGVGSYRTHWNVIESTIDAHNPSDPEDPMELRVLKTVGILNLLNVDDLRPTREAICLAVAGCSPSKQREVRDILDRLGEKRILFFRGAARGYSLWPYTSVDLETRLEEAKRAIPRVAKISEVIIDQLEAQPIVARAHYIQTGNLRYFNVLYCKPEELLEQAAEHKSTADGLILVPLCETETETKECKALARRAEPRRDLILIITVPRPLSYLNQASLDALRWEWIQQNTPELNNDRYAREEVQIHLQEAKNRLKSQIQQFVGLNRITGESSLTWFFHENNQKVEIKFGSGRQALRRLSILCDQVYHRAPRIKNELINRHILSAAASAARMRLVELMFASGDQPGLGLPEDRKPPEKSMYLSVLQNTGLHRNIEGNWKLSVPASGREDCSLVRPALKKIKKILFQNPDTRVSIATLMEELRQPPYGLRAGLFPIFLAVIAIENEQEVAFYENGTFLREVGKEAFLRMNKAPEKFEIQFCKIEGVRSQLFSQLAHILKLEKTTTKEIELLDIVTNLCKFVANQPEFTRQTKRLQPKTLAVREAILQAREPIRMVFHDLPKACGCPGFEIGKAASAEDAERFVKNLKVALDEIREAFPSLQRRIESGLARELGYGELPANQYRQKIANRSEKLLVRVTENKLKVFAFRLFDEVLSTSEWLNSVGSVLALRPPDKWKDEDEDTFHNELESAAGRFKRAESAGFSHGKAGQGLRVAITKSDGTERQEVIHVDAEEERTLQELQMEIAQVIKKNERLGVAAASRAIWSQLKATKEQHER